MQREFNIQHILSSFNRMFIFDSCCVFDIFIKLISPFNVCIFIGWNFFSWKTKDKLNQGCQRRRMFVLVLFCFVFVFVFLHKGCQKCWICFLVFLLPLQGLPKTQDFCLVFVYLHKGCQRHCCLRIFGVSLSCMEVNKLEVVKPGYFSLPFEISLIIKYC